MRYELKARSLSEILDGTFKLYRDDFGKFLGIAAVANIPAIVQAYMGVGRFDFQAAFKSGFKAGQAAQAGEPPLLFLVNLLVMAAFVVTSCALASATTDAYLGRPFSIGGSLLRGLKLFPRGLWIFVIYAFRVFIGFLLLLIPGIRLSIGWALWPQAVVMEDLAGGAALRRSWALTKGSLGRLGSLLIVFTVVQLAFYFGLSGVVTAVTKGLPIAGAVLAQLPSVLMLPAYSALLTLFYFDGRIRHEGYDIEMKAREEPPANPMVSVS